MNSLVNGCLVGLNVEMHAVVYKLTSALYAVSSGVTRVHV